MAAKLNLTLFQFCVWSSGLITEKKIIITLSNFCQQVFVLFFFCHLFLLYFLRFLLKKSEVPENQSEVRLLGTSELKKKIKKQNKNKYMTKKLLKNLGILMKIRFHSSNKLYMHNI